MATTGVMNGTLLKVTVGGTAIAYLTSNDESLKNNLRETTTKDSGGYATFAGGKKEADYNFEMLHVEGATNGYSTLFAAWAAGTVLSVEMTTAVTGDKKYSASALISSLSRTAPTEDNTGVSGSLKITGAITEATI